MRRILEASLQKSNTCSAILLLNIQQSAGEILMHFAEAIDEARMEIGGAKQITLSIWSLSLLGPPSPILWHCPMEINHGDLIIELAQCQCMYSVSQSTVLPYSFSWRMAKVRWVPGTPS